MYLGVNSLRFRSESIPMGIMSRGGICLPVTPVTYALLNMARQFIVSIPEFTIGVMVPTDYWHHL